MKEIVRLKCLLCKGCSAGRKGITLCYTIIGHNSPDWTTAPMAASSHEPALSVQCFSTHCHMFVGIRANYNDK